MRKIMLLLVVLVAAAGLAACGGKKAKCERVLDKVVDLTVAMADGMQAMLPAEQRKSTADLKAEMKKKMDEGRADMLTACVDKVPETALDCVIDAKDVTGLSKCGPELAALGGK